MYAYTKNYVRNERQTNLFVEQVESWALYCMDVLFKGAIFKV